MDSNYYSRFANSEYEEIVLDVFRRYEQKVLKNNSMDFDDLLLLPIKLFKKYPEVFGKVSR